MDVPQPIRTVTVVSLAGFAALTFQTLEHYQPMTPDKPVFGSPAQTAGTAITQGEGGYYSRPPDAPVDTPVRRVMAGSAIFPDS